MTDSEITKFYYNNIKGHAYTMKTIMSRFPEFYTNIINRFNDLRGDEIVSEIIYRIEHKLEEHPKCAICGKLLKYFNNKGRYANRFCSKECEYSPEAQLLIKNRVKQTKLEKYGNEYWNNREKYKQTNLIKFGHENPNQNKNITDKAKVTRNKTMMKRYGVSNIMFLNEYKDKIKQTKLEKYGAANYVNVEKAQLTCLEKYGISLFNTSPREDQLYNILKEHIDANTIRQYKSEEYPYFCDFYLPKYNLYIELQVMWTHGYHPFNNDNPDDILRLNKLKSKDGNYYKEAIKTWTIKDVEKRTVALNNNLNFLEIFSNNPDEYKDIVINFIKTNITDEL